MNQNNDTFLSVIIPAYNEEKRIVPTLKSVTEYLSQKPFVSEVLVVDDGSSDKTSRVVDEFARSPEGSRIRILNGEPNHGKGYAVRRGMTSSRGEWRLFMDADGSVSISELDKFLKHGSEGFDVVIGSIAYPEQGKSVVEHAGIHRRVLGSISKLLVRTVAVPGIYDTQRGFKLFSHKASETIFSRQTIERFGFDIELLVIAQTHGLKIKEIPVTWENPAGSTLGLKDYWHTLKELIRIMNNRSMRTYA